MEMFSFLIHSIMFSRSPVVIILVLALFAAAVSTPFAIIFRFGGYSRHVKLVHPILFLVAPVFEEAVFRWFILTALLGIYSPMVALIGSTVLYTIYMNVVYGTPQIAEGIVTGILFGVAFLQFGLIPVIIAHIIYRALIFAWA